MVPTVPAAAFAAHPRGGENHMSTEHPPGVLRRPARAMAAMAVVERVVNVESDR